MWRKLLPYWRPSLGRSAAGIAALLAAAGLELLLPWPVKWLVDHVLGDQPPSALLAQIWPPFAAGDKTAALWGVCAAVVLFAVAHRAATLVSQLLLIGVGGRVVLQLRCRGYEQFCRLSVAYHDKTKVGDSLYRVAYDTQAAMSLISSGLMPLLQGALILVGVLAILARMDLFLTLIASAIAPVFWICIRAFGKRIDGHSRRYHENESALLSTVQESLSSMRAMQAFTREPDTALRFGQQATNSFGINLRLVKTQLLFSGSVGLAMAAGTAAAIWFGAHRVMAGQLSAGDILVFLAYLAMLYQPLNAFSQSASVVQSARAQLRRVFEVLDASAEIVDRPGAQALAKVRGEIEFRGVAFAYKPAEPVLHDVSFATRPGEVIALVGPTGAGKSTLSSLLLRFYDPTGGAVLLDGHDLRDLQLAWLRRQVSVVLQDALLLSGTIRDNIAYGRPEATMAEIEAAARKAQADDFIRALPEGYQTNLAERAVNLSGGQKQRIAIARAFLKDAPILVLDEPTSALDVQTEEALLVALKTLMQGRTTFIIAHRLSTVRLAHRIIVMRDGRIVEQGSHEALMGRESFYRSLHDTQTLRPDSLPVTAVPS
ncbi:MAG: ABC transporter ATP-binding protein [Opitutaceae bacterium]|nr:ABC transporter ATP-binding protein [Opitutaceae bacterium]